MPVLRRGREEAVDQDQRPPLPGLAVGEPHAVAALEELGGELIDHAFILSPALQGRVELS